MQLEELNDITASLRQMPDQALQRFAMMHKDDPYIMSLAVSESNQRRKLRAAASTPRVNPAPTIADAEIAQMGVPDMSGIAALPAPNMETMNAAAGGIVGGTDDYDMAVGYAEGGMVERYQRGGNTRDLFEKALDAEGVTDPRERAFLRSIHMQESGGKATAKTSNRGAVGAMQILPATFSSVADKGMNINDPLDNMRAGIRYGRQGFQAAGGDPVLAGAYYYGGPGGMAKAAKGEAVADPKNPNAPTTIDYGKQVAARMTQLLPISTAQAEPTKAPTTDREKLISQIPGQTAAGRTTAPEPEPERRPQDYLFGAGETGLALLTGAMSPVTGLIRKAGQEIVYGKSEPMAQQMAATTFAPRGEAGQAMTEGLARVAQDLKIPGYIPAVGPAAPTLRRAPRTGELITKADDATARLAEEQARLAALVGPPSTAQTPGQARAAATTLSQREAAVDQAQRAAGVAQQEAAKARVATERIGQEAAYAQGAGQRANVAALGALGAQTGAQTEVPPEAPAAIPTPGDESYDRLEKRRFIEQQMGKLDTDLSKKDIIDAAKEAAPQAGSRKGWGPEDWLLLGLGMMGSQNRTFLGALGEAGAGVIREKREQKKEEAAELYRRALTREAEAKAKVYESGTGEVAKATAYADKAFDNWLNGVKANPLLMMNVTPEQIEEKRRQYLREAYDMFKIPMPAGVGTGAAGGFKVLGSRPS